MNFSKRKVVENGFRWISFNLVLSKVFWISIFILFGFDILENNAEQPMPVSNYQNSLLSHSKLVNDRNMVDEGSQIPKDTIPVISIFEQNGSVVNSNSHFRGNFPDRLFGTITTGQTSRRFTLNKHLALLSDNYKEIYYENSKRVVTIPSSGAQTFCYYDGRIDRDADSYITLNLCKQEMKGTVFMSGKHYVIDHLRLLPAQQQLNTQIGTCGHPDNSLIRNATFVHARRRRALSRPSYYKKYVTWKELYVELAIVFDNSLYKKFGQDKKRLFDRAKELTSFINSYYQPVRIKVALAGVEIWSENDRIVVSDSGDVALDQFLRYRGVNLVYDIPNDHAQLLTNVTFNGGVVGKAMKGTMCSTIASGAVVMDHDRFSTPAPIAATMAHEMGHNFGMEHDNETCECPEQRCLMAASSSGAGNVYWSSCSLEHLSWSLSHGADYCLRNIPKSTKEPMCGNGFVEEGEDCDCGIPDVCDNHCCDAKTCKLTKGSVCANGDCCDISSCQYMPLSSVCRASENECDLPEYCNGKSEVCPKDTYKQNGIPCHGGTAFCYNGTCASHDDQCKLIWGPTGSSASKECYTLNIRGTDEGHCGVDERNGAPKRCENSDTVCGLLQCTHKTEKTSYGDRSVVKTTSVVLHTSDGVSNCHTAIINLGLDRQNPGLVQNGAKCGDGMMCRGQKCIAVSDVLKENPCPSNCHDSGVCNNLGHCHCVHGYGGIDCSIPGLGGSIDSGPASTGVGRFNVGVGILIFLLIILPLITVAITLMYRKGIIKRPRSKIFDLFKPRRMKTRLPSTGFTGTVQNRARQSSSTTVNQKAPAIMAFPAEARTYPSRPRSNEFGDLDYLKKSTGDQLVSQPLITATTELNHLETHAPPRPARPSGEVLERLYYNDPTVQYAPVNTEDASAMKDGCSIAESFESEVMTALELDYGPAISPRRRAPPPPVEEAKGKNLDADDKNPSTANLVQERKRYFQTMGSAKKNLESISETSDMAKEKTPGISKTQEKRLTREISDPLNPIIGGEPVAQASSLMVVAHLETQTLRRNKSKEAPSTLGSGLLENRMNKRKSSAVDDSEWRKGKARSNAIQRSQSSVSGCRPRIAPPPPPPPPIAPKPFSKSQPKPATIENSNDSAVLSNSGESSKTAPVFGTAENYYDVIASPVDEEKEAVYADIDELRASMKIPLKPKVLPKKPLPK